MTTSIHRVVLILAWTVAAVVLLAGGAVGWAAMSYDREWNIPFPATRASADPAVITRGEYLVNGPAHCSDCHTPMSARDRLFRGEVVELTGGTDEATWLGTWTAPNLTPDPATGLGEVSDGQIARTLRHGVDRNGRIALPFKDAFADMSEDDLTAIISYLRTLPAASGVAPTESVNLWGKITLAYFLQPYDPASEPPATLRPDTTIEYGEYLANVLGRCGSCHTPRNLKSGEYLGPRFSGGLPFDSRDHPGAVYISPNLTPDSITGHMARWDEETFVQRMRTGAIIADSPMPWGSYMRMTDGDLRAMYRYLQSLEPVRRDNGPMVQQGEADSWPE